MRIPDINNTNGVLFFPLLAMAAAGAIPRLITILIFYDTLRSISKCVISNKKIIEDNKSFFKLL